MVTKDKIKLVIKKINEEFSETPVDRVARKLHEDGITSFDFIKMTQENFSISDAISVNLTNSLRDLESGMLKKPTKPVSLMFSS